MQFRTHTHIYQQQIPVNRGLQKYKQIIMYVCVCVSYKAQVFAYQTQAKICVHADMENEI